MKNAVARFYDFLARPLFPSARLLLAVLVIPLLLSLTQPLWRISMLAPQYPSGLYLDIYAHKVDAGNDGHDVVEINTLNHYIGMHKIERSELADLDWLPFALGALALLTLRVAAIGDVLALLDLTVLCTYVFLFSFGRFYYRLYVFGHHLDPTAPVKVQPFTPVVFGTKQIANFTTTSLPQAGSLLVTAFAVGAVALLVWHLVAGRLAAERADRTAATRSA